MSKWFYPKLAITNIKKNSKTYIPYIITSVATIMMYYIIFALSKNDDLDKISGGGDIKMILTFGTYVVAIFAVIFLFYTNSFLIKRRKKEFGLYNILGMEKKHISKVMFYETVYVLLFTIIVGIISGILLSKLMYLILLKILHFKVELGFSVSIIGMITSILLFCLIFLVTFLNTLRQIHLANPIELLKGGEVGEREPKTKWILTLIGIFTLGAGYYLSISTESPIKALYLFFIAVVLVIIGTYCLFTAGSIALLKMLRKNKTYYYKPKHFTSVSSMIYRMKQNAVGLANICILSTIVLVMISTTVSLYIGQEDVFESRFHRDFSIQTLQSNENDISTINTKVDHVLENYHLEKENTINYHYLEFAAEQSADTFNTTIDFLSPDAKYLVFITVEDYNRLENKTETLESGEVLLYTNVKDYSYDKFSLFNQTYNVKKELNSFSNVDVVTAAVIDCFYIVVKDISVIDSINLAQAEAYGDNKSELTYYLGFDLNTDNETQIKICNDLINNGLPVISVAQNRDSFYAAYGSMFFLGIFLGLLFIMATVLIMYYKQISEGYDDKERFAIMKKVGMSRSEISKSIRSQILSLFFLPLIVACIHIAFAFPVITRLLALFNLTNVTLFIWCTIGTILVFGIFYAIIYVLTAREYYKIVS